MAESEDLFVRESPIFANKELLEVGRLPEEERIVEIGRAHV